MSDSLRERLRTELAGLITEGVELAKLLGPETDEAAGQLQFVFRYQKWYTPARAAVEQLTPARLEEFEALCQPKKRKQMGYTAYGVQDYLLGVTFVTDILAGDTADTRQLALARLMQQVLILKSAHAQLDCLLANAQALIQAEILDSELQAARDLLKSNYYRPAGVLAGVVLERHLARVARARGLKSLKKQPGLSDWNDLLKSAQVYDVPEWRRIQRLGDLRNLCAHPKERDPTPDEVDELIAGTDRVTKAVN